MKHNGFFGAEEPCTLAPPLHTNAKGQTMTETQRAAPTTYPIHAAGHMITRRPPDPATLCDSAPRRLRYFVAPIDRPAVGYWRDSLRAAWQLADGLGRRRARADGA